MLRRINAAIAIMAGAVILTPWTANAASAGGTLSDPAANRVATAIMAVDLIDSINWASAGQIADDAGVMIALIPSLSFGWNGEAQSGNGGDESEDLFHSVVNLVFAGFRRGSSNPIQPLQKFFRGHLREQITT